MKNTVYSIKISDWKVAYFIACLFWFKLFPYIPIYISIYILNCDVNMHDLCSDQLSQNLTGQHACILYCGMMLYFASTKEKTKIELYMIHP